MTNEFKYTGNRYRMAEDDQCSIHVRKEDDNSIGISVPKDGDELWYFSPTEVRMFAFALLAMVEDE
jgi:hypothetical protein